MFVIENSQGYQDRLKEFLKKHPDLKKQYEKTIRLLSNNPYYPSLRLHKFAANRYSVSVNMTYRISLNFKIVENKIVLYDIGTHREIYGKD